MLAVQSFSALALAAVVASPSGASSAGDTIARTRVAEKPAVMYGTTTDACPGLDASPRHAPVSRLPAGTAVNVLRVTAAHCDGFTLPLLEVRLAAAHGYIPAGSAAPLPIAGD